MGTWWTKAQDAAIDRMTEDGAALEEIAAAVHRGAAQVELRRAQLAALRHAERPWSAADDAELRRLKQLRLGWPAIGAALGRPTEKVKQRAADLGLAGGGESHAKPGQVAGAAKMRRCLCCQVRFYSAGIENRVCNPCKGTETWRIGGATGCGNAGGRVGMRAGT